METRKRRAGNNRPPGTRNGNVERIDGPTKKKDGEIDIDHPDYPDDPSRRLCAEDWGSARDPRQGPMGLFPFSLPAPGAVFCMTGPGFSMHVVLFSNVPLLLPLCSAR